MTAWRWLTRQWHAGAIIDGLIAENALWRTQNELQAIEIRQLTAKLTHTAKQLHNRNETIAQMVEAVDRQILWQQPVASDGKPVLH